MPEPLNIALGVLFDFLRVSWWLWLFLILLPIFKSIYLHWRQENFKHSKAFDMGILEIKMPREINKSPKAMEQILMAIHSLRNAPGDFQEKWINGEVTVWFALEMVSFGGNIHFYIRFPRARKSLIEAAFFSYYPDIELIEVDDYTERFPQNMIELQERGYDLWGTEMVLTKEDAYPIKIYSDFESPDEDKQYDPISQFLEVLGRCNKEDIVGIQFLIAPAGVDYDHKYNWNKKYEKLVEELRERKNKQQAQAQPQTGVPLNLSFMRTPGETDILKKVEENLSKPAFDTLIRFIYLSPKTLFNDGYARRGLVGAFNQYADLGLNSFVQNYDVSTRTRFWDWPHIFPEKRNLYRKASLLYNYIHRECPPETFMGKLITSNIFRSNFSSRRILLTTQCLATLFHPPTAMVTTTPHLEKTQSRKASPPPALPIFGEEKEIEKFYE
jgi:hypothetical protein